MWMEFAELDADSRKALPDNKFAWIDSAGQRHLPIHDANHVKAALSRINQTKDSKTGAYMTPAQKTAALAKIRGAGKRLGVDMAKAASEIAQGMTFANPGPGVYPGGNGPFGPGGDMDWDDKEEPDESEDGGAGDLTQNKRKSAAQPKEEPNDDEGGDEGFEGDEPGMGDVHVPGPINQVTQKYQKSGTLKGVVKSVRAHFASGRVLSAENFDKILRQETGRTGGKAPKKKAGESNADESTRYGTPQEGEIRSYHEGSAHFTDSGGTGYRMFLPLKFAEFDGRDGWFEYIPAPGTWENPRFGKIGITLERNRRFVENFNNGVYQDRIPIDAEHESKLSGALGWITRGNMKLSPSGAIMAFAEWTDRGRTMLVEKRFRYFSPEWYDQWTEPASEKVLQDIAIGGAVTTRPFFKPSSLQPLVANEQGLAPATTEEMGEMAGDNASKDPVTEPTKTATEPTKSKTFAELETEYEAKAVEAAQATESLKQMKEELDVARKATETKDSELKQLTERVSAMETDKRRREFRETAKDFPGETDKHVALMEKLDEDGLKSYVEIQTSAAEQIKAGNIFTPIGSTQRRDSAADDEVEKVRQMAEQKVKEGNGKVTMAKAAAESWSEQAYAEYAKAHPEQYR